MEEHIVVAHLIHAAVGQNNLDVLVQFLNNAERVVQLMHQLLLVFSEAVGVLGVDSREGVAAQGISLTVELDGPVLIVDVVE